MSEELNFKLAYFKVNLLQMTTILECDFADKPTMVLTIGEEARFV